MSAKNKRQPWLDHKELTEFIEELRVSGYNIGLAQHLAVLDLEFKLASINTKSQTILNDPSEFRDFLGPILCSSEQEQIDFKKRYDSKFLKLKLKQEREPETTAQKEFTKEIKKIKRRSLWFWSWVLLLVVMLLLGEIYIDLGTTAEETPIAETPIAETPIAETETTPIKETIPEGVDRARSEDTSIRENPIGTVEPIWSPLEISVIAIAIIVLLIILIKNLRWYWEAHQYLKRIKTASKPETSPLPLMSESIFPQQLLIYTARDFRRRKQTSSNELDVDLMFKEYIAQGGFLEDIITKKRKVSIEYLFLIDSTSPVDHLAAFAQNLAQQLKQKDVYIDTYTFDKDPRLCLPESSTKAAVSLDDLAVKYSNYRLVIFSDVVNWRNPLTGTLGTWVGTLEKWSERALFTPKERGTWGNLEQDIVQYIMVLPSDAEGLKEFIAILGNTNKYTFDNSKSQIEQTECYPYPEDLHWQPRRWLERYALEKEVIDEMLLSLKNYLDDAGYYWLCACAIFPAIRWYLTLYLGQQLYLDQHVGKEKIFSVTRLKNLSRLPWFRYGYMPDWLRRELITSLTPKQEIRVRKVIETLLTDVSIKALFEDAPEDLNSDYTIEVALSTGNLPKSLSIWIIRLLGNKSERDNPIRDQIFKTFVFGGLDTLLAVRLPVQVNKVLSDLFKYTVRAFHRLAMVLSFLVLAVFVNGDVLFDIYRNTDWIPRKRDFNGATMVLVPRGGFTMGSTEEEIDFAVELCKEDDLFCSKSTFKDEKPTSIQYFSSPFWIDETEVTREAYDKCAAAGVCNSKSNNEWSDSPNQPINLVDWNEATKYCKWRGARLPTEAEWEYAARGPDGPIFPWGNEFDENKVRYFQNSGNKTTDVGNYLEGKSWVGALDMSGNVWEWVNSLYKDYPYIVDDGREVGEIEESISELRALCGGSFRSDPWNLRAANRVRYFPSVEFVSNGFRCARSQ